MAKPGSTRWNFCQIFSSSLSYTPVRPSSRPYYVLNNYLLENTDSRYKDANKFGLKYLKFQFAVTPGCVFTVFTLCPSDVLTAILRRPHCVLGVSTATIACALRVHCDCYCDHSTSLQLNLSQYSINNSRFAVTTQSRRHRHGKIAVRTLVALPQDRRVNFYC